jgi:hypothetical protein
MTTSKVIYAVNDKAVCRKCAEQTPLLITSVVMEGITDGIVTEIIGGRCNAKEEHGDRAETHSWEVPADRRQAPPAKEESMASFTINSWLTAMMQYVGLGISHIKASLGFLGLKG